MRFYRGILLVFLLCQNVLSQSYPRWFLNPLCLRCDDVFVGMARRSYYPDSSAAQAIQNGYMAYARQKEITVAGGQAFWSTESGVYSMGSDFVFKFDSTAVHTASTLLYPADTLFTPSLTAVLLVPKGCAVPELQKEHLEIKSTRAPTWIEKLPSQEGYLYSVGTSEEWYYELSSWQTAEKNALISLAKSVYMTIKGLQKLDRQRQVVTNAEFAVQLFNVQVVGRWKDMNKRITFVLVRMPLNDKND